MTSSAATTNRRRFTPLVALAFLCASFVTTVSALTASTVVSAHADPPGCGLTCVQPPATGGGGGGNGPDPDPGDPGDNDDGGNNGGGGGSGGVLPPHEWAMSGQGWFPSRPPAKIGDTDPANGWSENSAVYHYGGKCDGKYTWSANGSTYHEDYLGWKWWLIGVWQPPHMDPGSGEIGSTYDDLKSATGGGYDCIPPPKYYEYPVNCAIKGTAKFRGPFYNSDPENGKVKRLPTQWSQFAKTGRSNPDLCAQSYTFQFGQSPKKWGQYQLEGEAHSQICTVRRYYTVDPRTGSKPAPEIMGCSKTFGNGTLYDRVELFCESPYVHRNWHNYHTFTAADCLDAGDSGWTCGPQVDKDPTFARKNGNPFSVLDDGKARRASWRTPVPDGGIRKVKNRKSVLNYLSGSPFRADAPKNGSTQPFYAYPKNDAIASNWNQAAKAGSKNTAWDLSFLAPGTEGSPWTARPKWSFNAEFQSFVPKITWDLWNGQLSYELIEVWIPASASCVGQPIHVNVHRARNSSH